MNELSVVASAGDCSWVLASNRDSWISTRNSPLFVSENGGHWLPAEALSILLKSRKTVGHDYSLELREWPFT